MRRDIEHISYYFQLGFVLHLDKHLGALVAEHGARTYAILFAIVFCETGLVVTPFLPGDSLLFAAGTLCALGTALLHLHTHGLRRTRIEGSTSPRPSGVQHSRDCALLAQPGCLSASAPLLQGLSA